MHPRRIRAIGPGDGKDRFSRNPSSETWEAKGQEWNTPDTSVTRNKVLSTLCWPLERVALPLPCQYHEWVILWAVTIVRIHVGQSLGTNPQRAIRTAANDQGTD